MNNTNINNNNDNNVVSNQNSVKNKIKKMRAKIKNTKSIVKSCDIISKRLKNLNECFEQINQTLQICDLESNNNNNQWNILFRKFKPNAMQEIDYEHDLDINVKLNIICGILQVVSEYVTKDMTLTKNQINEFYNTKCYIDTFVKQLILEFNNEVKVITNEISRDENKNDKNSNNNNNNTTVNGSDNTYDINKMLNISDVLEKINTNNVINQNTISKLDENSIGNNNNNNTGMLKHNNNNNNNDNNLNNNDNNISNKVNNKSDSSKYMINSLFHLYTFDQNTNIKSVIKEKKRKNNLSNAIKKTRQRRKTKMSS
jgi:hypothetical protein